jgi:hypothetical protein
LVKDEFLRIQVMSDRANMSAGSDSPTETYCPVVELRQYTLHPGKRHVLIDLFDREFVESQEAVGMKIIGQFRDHRSSNSVEGISMMVTDSFGSGVFPTCLRGQRRSRIFTAVRFGKRTEKRLTLP